MFVVCMTPVVGDRLLEYIRFHQQNGVHHMAVYVDAENGSVDFPDLEGVSWRYADHEFFQDNAVGDILDLDARLTVVRHHAANTASRLGYSFFAHIDDDELLFAPGGLDKLLSDLHPQARSIRLPTLEAVNVRTGKPEGGFDCTWFIDPAKVHDLVGTRSWLGRLLLGKRFQFAPSGTLGHTIGKSIYRLPIAYQTWSQHQPKPGPEVTADHARLLHFDNCDYEQWKSKWQRRTTGGQHASGMRKIRRFLAEEIESSLQVEGATEAFYAQYISMSPIRAKLLQVLGIVHRIVAVSERR